MNVRCGIHLIHLIIPFVCRRSCVIIILVLPPTRSTLPHIVVHVTRIRSLARQPGNVVKPILLPSPLSPVTCPTSPPYEHLWLSLFRLHEKSVPLRSSLPADNQVNVNPGLVYRHFTLGSWISRGNAVETRAASTFLRSIDRLSRVGTT